MFNLSDYIPFFDQLPFEVREWVLRIGVALIIFFLVLVLRRVLTWILLAPFRAIAQRTINKVDDTILHVVEDAAGYIIVAIALLLSAQVIYLGNTEAVFLGRLARTLIIVGVAVALYRTIALVEQDSRVFNATGLNIDAQLYPFIRTALRIVLVAVAGVIIIQEWGYNVSGLVAGLGLGGLAFSLAAQDTVSNLFGFSTIVGDRPFVVGEYIITKDGEGIVERVGVRSTRIRTLDQSLIIVPNSTLANSAVTNWSRVVFRRYNFTIGLTYATDSRQMQALLENIREMLSERPLVRNDSIVVRFTEFGASSLDVLVRCNVDTPYWNDWAAEREQINLAIMDIVEAHGLSFAFPSRSVYLESMPSHASIGAPPPAPSASVPHNTDTAQQDDPEDAPTTGV